MSLQVASSPVKPPDVNAARQTPWLQPDGILSRELCSAAPDLLAHGKGDIIHVHRSGGLKYMVIY